MAQTLNAVQDDGLVHRITIQKITIGRERTFKQIFKLNKFYQTLEINDFVITATLDLSDTLGTREKCRLNRVSLKSRGQKITRV